MCPNNITFLTDKDLNQKCWGKTVYILAKDEASKKENFKSK